MQKFIELNLSNFLKPYLQEEDIKQEELSVVFIKLQLLMCSLVDKISDSSEKVKASVLYDDLTLGFIRAIQDVKKVPAKLPNLEESTTLEFVDNFDKVHAELAVLIARLIKLKATNNYIDATELLTHYLGVSKLSCEECYGLFKAIELAEYVRGGHGNCFHAIWTMPKIEAQDAENNIIDLGSKIAEYLSCKEESDHICTGIKSSDHCADISDDESENISISGNTLSPERFINSSSFFRDLATYLLSIGFGFDSITSSGQASSSGISAYTSDAKLDVAGDVLLETIKSPSD